MENQEQGTSINMENAESNRYQNLSSILNSNNTPSTETYDDYDDKMGDYSLNGWNPVNSAIVGKFIFKLKYNKEINSFFFFELKSKENFWSWIIIVLSTLTSTATLLNSIEEEPFEYFFTTIQIIMVIFSISITLIAAWMKKQQYVDRINTIDRYLQKLILTIEEVQFQLYLNPNDRDSYDDFKTKQFKIINEFLGTSPSMSPFEWKNTVYQITKYYPEVIYQDGFIENKLWPWYSYKYNKKLQKIVRKRTKFGASIMNTYHSLTCLGQLYDCCCNSNEKEQNNDYLDLPITDWEIGDRFRYIKDKELLDSLFTEYGLNYIHKEKSNIEGEIIKLDLNNRVGLVGFDIDKGTDNYGKYPIPLSTIVKL